MKTIPLSQGKIALVDDVDFLSLSQQKWYAKKQGNTYYAMRRRGILMHRVILNAPDGVVVDHRNSYGLDNRRSNLRLCSHSENIRHQRLSRLNKTGFKGVTTVKDVPQKPFRARIKVNNRTLCLGYYRTAREAANAYDRAALKYHGEFASGNI